MYGLPQAGIIAQQLLEERLQKAGYTQKQTHSTLLEAQMATYQLHTRRG